MFRRAFNILTWLLEYAHKKTLQSDISQTAAFWIRAHDYAVKLNQGVIDSRAQHKRDIAFWGDETALRRHLHDEYTQNFERYKVCLGCIWQSGR